MADDDFSTIAIVGLGLIGGSLGLSLQSALPQSTVVGWDRSPEVTAAALDRGVIDQNTAAIDAAVQNADLVIVATPVLTVEAVFEAIAPHLKPGAIVSDVASTKVRVVAWAEAILPDTVTFVGGHPMAGSEQHGIANARSDLFNGAVYCLTPTAATPSIAVTQVDRLVRSIGAQPLHIDVHTHDAAVAAISHLPFVLAAVLVEHATTDAAWNNMRKLAATGFRDTTRLASGDVRMHRDICLTNAAALMHHLLGMAQRLEEIADHLDDPVYLERLFGEAKEQRDAWLAFTTEARKRD